MVIRGAAAPSFALDYANLQAWSNPFGTQAPAPTTLPFNPAAQPLFGADGFDVSALPGADQSGLQRFIAANQGEFDGAIDTPAELKKLLQMLNQGEGRTNGLPKLETKPGAELGNMNTQELLQLLIDYLRDFGPQSQNQAQAPAPRMLGNLGGGGGGGGGGMRSGGGGGGGGGGAPAASGGGGGGAVSSTAGAQGTADIAGAKNLSAEQKKNAQTIIDVGHKMGASERDIQIALMTAMQESNLKNLNYGDRDSLGLFQQRPSCGWGTPAQVTNPEYAAGKFFESLLKIPNRDSMSLTQAAQAVQRSAYPDAYAKWEGLARGLLDGSVGGNGNTALA